MKKITTLILLLFCISAYAQKNEIRDVGEFTALSLNVPGTVHLTQSSTQKVELKGSESTLEKIETEVRNGRLIIKNRDNGSWFQWNNLGNIDIYISVKELEQIHIAGSGRIYSENTFKTDEMELDVSGSGSMEIKVEANLVDASISGSGDIEIEGTAGNIELRISGSGDIHADALVSKSCEVHISGSGQCEVNVSEKLDVRISGSGSVYYKGDPSHVDSSSSGSGKVRKIS